LLLLGCSKKDDVVQPQVVNSNQNLNVLSFSSEEFKAIFDDSVSRASYIENIRKQSKFISLSKFRHGRNDFRILGIQSTKLLNDTLLPEVLLEILNQDGVIQIDNYLIRIDPINSKVFVLENSNMALYEELLKDKPDSTFVSVFSTEVQVLEELKLPKEQQNDYRKTNPNTRTEFCLSWCCNRAAGGFSQSAGNGKAEYLKFGIYFKFFGITYSDNGRIWFYTKFRLRCSSTLESTKNYYGFNPTRVAYEGTNALEKYTFNMYSYNFNNGVEGRINRTDGY